MRGLISNSLNQQGFNQSFTLQIENFLLALGIQKFLEISKSAPEPQVLPEKFAQAEPPQAMEEVKQGPQEDL
jgi:hypothetical protein